MTARTSIEDRDAELLVVVADDDPNEQLLLSAAAQDVSLSAQFEFVEDGLELLGLLERRERAGSLPDIVVLDLRMPRLDGHQALLAITEHQAWWDIPVLVWTSSGDPAEPERCWREGAVWFEQKPESFEGYVALVNTLEERCRRAREVAAASIDWDALVGALLGEDPPTSPRRGDRAVDADDG